MDSFKRFTDTKCHHEEHPLGVSLVTDKFGFKLLIGHLVSNVIAIGQVLSELLHFKVSPQSPFGCLSGHQ